MVLATATASDALYRRGELWPSSSDGITRIPICFRTSGDYTTQEEARLRALVREGLAATWGRWANIEFSGFGECASPPANATLAIMLTEWAPPPPDGCHDAPVNSKGWCRQSGGAGDIPDQNLHKSGLRGFQGTATPTYGWLQLEGVPDRHVWAIVSHEVGHALSFEHEQSRPDAVGTCPFGDSIIPGGTVLSGDYDDMSTMNYCVPYDFGHVSWKDISGAQGLYGTSAAGQWLKVLPVLSHMGIL
jgi:hypothetical protein